MPLVDNHIEVTIGSYNVKHYEGLGYKIPRYRDKEYRLKILRGTKIIVKIEDLPENSHSNVKIKCSMCGAVRNVQYRTFSRSSDLCRSCSCYIAFPKGKNSHVYRGGRSSVQTLIRGSAENGKWIKAIFKKNNYQCQSCGINGRLDVHHIINFSELLNLYNITKENWNEYKHILFNVQNGVVLCRMCHTELHKYCGGIHQPSSKRKLDEFLNKETYE